MAVYKATYCYPFLNAVDIRVGLTDEKLAPAQYLKCKVDTSNKKITGYKIRILDGNNNQIFPYDNQDGKISPIAELNTSTMSDVSSAKSTNSGINGTYLQIPFFQNYDVNALHTVTDMKLKSYNAVYYKARYLIDHIIVPSSLAPDDGSNLSNWTLDATDDILKYNLISQKKGKLIIDGESVAFGERVVVIDSTKSNMTGLWSVSKAPADGVIGMVPVLRRITTFSDAYGHSTNDFNDGEMGCITKGTTFHNTI